MTRAPKNKKIAFIFYFLLPKVRNITLTTAYVHLSNYLRFIPLTTAYILSMINFFMSIILRVILSVVTLYVTYISYIMYE